MRKIIQRQLHTEEGFSLAETLMTVILIGLVTMTMAAGILAARNAYQRISLRADAQTLLGTAVSAITDELADAKESVGEYKTAEHDGFFYVTSRGYRIKLVNGTDKDANGKDRKCIRIVSEDGSLDVPLLTGKTRTKNLQLYLEPAEITYETGKMKTEDGYYFALKVVVADDKGNVIEDADLRIHNQFTE